MGKNLNPHAGMGFLAGRVRVSGCRYGMALPDGFPPVAISTREMFQFLSIVVEVFKIFSIFTTTSTYDIMTT
jgi:hypothetical protein